MHGNKNYEKLRYFIIQSPETLEAYANIIWIFTDYKKAIEALVPEDTVGFI